MSILSEQEISEEATRLKRESDRFIRSLDEQIAGWKPPTIYDVGRDEKRIATQDDVDRLMRVASCYAELREQVTKLLQLQTAFIRQDDL